MTEGKQYHSYLDIYDFYSDLKFKALFLHLFSTLKILRIQVALIFFLSRILALFYKNTIFHKQQAKLILCFQKRPKDGAESTLCSKMQYYEVKRSLRHLLAAIENNRLVSPIGFSHSLGSKHSKVSVTKIGTGFFFLVVYYGSF